MRIAGIGANTGRVRKRARKMRWWLFIILFSCLSGQNSAAMPGLLRTTCGVGCVRTKIVSVLLKVASDIQEEAYFFPDVTSG